MASASLSFPLQASIFWPNGLKWSKGCLFSIMQNKVSVLNYTNTKVGGVPEASVMANPFDVKQGENKLSSPGYYCCCLFNM